MCYECNIFDNFGSNMDKTKHWVKNVIKKLNPMAQGWVKTTQPFLECNIKVSLSKVRLKIKI